MKKIESENDVKELVKTWFAKRLGWSYAPIQNGMGEHGIHDRVGCIPIVVTPSMVGKQIGLFVSIEAKAPGRRDEKYRGMSWHQQDKVEKITLARGLSICCDGVEDLAGLEHRIEELTSVVLSEG